LHGSLSAKTFSQNASQLSRSTVASVKTASLPPFLERSSPPPKCRRNQTLNRFTKGQAPWRPVAVLSPIFSLLILSSIALLTDQRSALKENRPHQCRRIAGPPIPTLDPLFHPVAPPRLWPFFGLSKAPTFFSFLGMENGLCLRPFPCVAFGAVSRECSSWRFRSLGPLLPSGSPCSRLRRLFPAPFW